MWAIAGAAAVAGHGDGGSGIHRCYCCCLLRLANGGSSVLIEAERRERMYVGAAAVAGYGDCCCCCVQYLCGLSVSGGCGGVWRLLLLLLPLLRDVMARSTRSDLSDYCGLPEFTNGRQNPSRRAAAAVSGGLAASRIVQRGRGECRVRAWLRPPLKDDAPTPLSPSSPAAWGDLLWRSAPPAQSFDEKDGCD